MAPIVEGQVFSSLADFKNALRDWAIERNWTPHILDSDSHRVRAGCRSSPDCPFRIRCNYGAKKREAKVTTCDDNHTCEPFRASTEGKAHQDIKRAETGKLKFLLEAVPKLITVTLDTNVSEIIEAVERTYGQKIPTRQAQKVKANLTDRVKGPCRQCHRLGHTRRHCPQLRTSAPGPMDFSNLQQEITHFANEDGEDETYADGGLELEAEDGRGMDRMDFVSGHQHDGHEQLFTPAQHQQLPRSAHPQQLPNTVHLQQMPNPGHPQPTPNPQSMPNPGHSQQVPGPNDFSNLQQSASGIRVDPSIVNGLQRLSSRDAPMPDQSVVMQNPQTVAQPAVLHNPQTLGQSNATPTHRTPQETRLEAASLMQQAARLMQEAAMLNGEAARLNASVANL